MYAAVQDGRRLSTRTPIAHQSRERFDHHVALLTKEFGGRLLCNIDLEDITSLQRKRVAEGRAGRTINYEVCRLRQLLKHFGLCVFSDRIKSLRECQDAGRAMSLGDESTLIQAIGASRSLSLPPVFMISVDTWLRNSEPSVTKISSLKWERRCDRIGETHRAQIEG